MGGNPDATSNITLLPTAEVSLAAGANVSGTNQLSLLASAGSITTNATAHSVAHAAGAGGNTNATSIITPVATVTTATGSLLGAGSLVVTATFPSPSISTNAKRDTDFIDAGNSHRTQTIKPTSGVAFNSTVSLLAPSPLLHIGPAGQVIDQSGVTFTNTPSAIYVNNISNTISGGQVQIQATGSGTDTVTGNAQFNFGPAFGAVTIINDSAKNLTINNISVINPNLGSNLPANVQVTPYVPANFKYTTNSTTGGATLVKILNTSNSNILLNGVITNIGGTTSIVDANLAANTGGSIQSAGAGEMIQTSQLILQSLDGAIGASGTPINAQFVDVGTNPTYSATALNGVYLNLSALNETAAAMTVDGTSLVGSTISIRIQDSQFQLAGKGTITSQGSSYTFDSVVAGTSLSIDAGTSTAVGLTISAPAGLPAGSIVSRHGDVSLTAITGAITDTTGNTATNVGGRNVTLNAGLGIGTAADYLEVNVSGNVSATATAGVYLNQVLGSLAVNQISTPGDVQIQSAGQITDGNTAAASNITGNHLILQAASGIGTATDALKINAAFVEATPAPAGSGSITLAPR